MQLLKRLSNQKNQQAELTKKLFSMNEIKLNKTVFIGFFLFLFCVPIFAQNTVTGKVTSNGEVLPGVSIVVKGTSNGTTTDFDGNYAIRVDLPDDILVYSYIGFQTKEVTVGNQSVMDVELQEDVKALDEVVVIGYGSVKKSDLTGAVSSLRSDDLNQGIVTSVDQAIQGRAAGVQINQASAEPGGGVSVRIRGVNSITGGDQPLYVIDGVPINNEEMFTGGNAANIPLNGNPRNPLNSLNPNDIASIEILKDASSTAIYGSRGANGVVIITTKKGSSGLNVSIDSYLGVQTIYRHLDVLSTSEYIEAMNSLELARGNDILFTDADIAEIGEGTRWLDEVTRDAVVSNHNFSFSGGNEKSKFFVSGNHMNQEGVIKNSGFKRYSFRVNLDHKFNDKLTFDLSLTNSVLSNDHATEGAAVGIFQGPYYAAAIYEPTTPVRDEEGNLTDSPFLTISNPVYYAEGQLARTETNRLLASAGLSYQVLPELSAAFRLGVDRNTGRQDLYSTRESITGGAIRGSANVSNLERNNYLLQYTMTYNKDFSPNVKLNAVAGTTYEEFNNRSFFVGIDDFPTDILLTNNLGLGNVETVTLGSNKNKNTLLSYLVRANLTLFDKFLFTSSFRADGSSRFGENNKYGYFPSAALAYQLGKENFIPDFISNLKIRTSYGVTGNQEIGNFASLSTFALGSQAILGGSPFQGTAATRIANPDLKWESTTQADLGLDLGLFKERIQVSMDYFFKKTDDLLLNLPIPTSSGFNSILRNVGSLENKGFEFMIDSKNIVSENFSWNTSFQFSTIQNEVTDIGDLDAIITGNLFSSNYGLIRPGEELNSYYTYKVTGIFQTQEEVDNSAQPDSRPGNPILLDANEDGVITPDDRVIVGSPWPDFTFGLRNKFSFKNIDLDFFIDGQLGAELLNGNIIRSYNPQAPLQNGLRHVILNRWTPENPDTQWPSGIAPSTYGGSIINSLAIEDASFIRLQTVTLGYNLPTESLGFLDRARLYLTGQNLLILTDYTGLNPEGNINNQGNGAAENKAYPIARTITLGLNLGF